VTSPARKEEGSRMRVLGIFGACTLLVVILSFVIGIVTGYMLGIFPIIILATLLTWVVNNRFESRRIKRELEKEDLFGFLVVSSEIARYRYLVLGGNGASSSIRHTDLRR
jgi:Flp pilus assembly protein TadB